jgi:hypothetical protein
MAFFYVRKDSEKPLANQPIGAQPKFMPFAGERFEATMPNEAATFYLEKYPNTAPGTILIVSAEPECYRVSIPVIIDAPTPSYPPTA